MSEVSEFFKEAEAWIVKKTMRETLRRAMKLVQDVYVRTGSPCRETEPDTIEILTQNLAQLTIARDLLSDLIEGTVTIQKDRIGIEAYQNALDIQKDEER